MTVRKAAFAGQFYTDAVGTLKKELARFTEKKHEKIEAFGAVSPHAGYVYSGEAQGAVLSSIKPVSTYIILGTNHTGLGKPFGIDAERSWETPLGKAGINPELAQIIMQTSRHVEKDTLCHDSEHSIEVQLPFLQYLNKDFSFVPIVISHAAREVYDEIGKDLSIAVKKWGRKVVIIASSDMTHYEPEETAKAKDMKAIEKILTLDTGGFLDTIEKYNISMCGRAPCAVMMAASAGLGATKAKLIKYTTSAAASGDYSAVVGYAGIVVY